MKGRELISKKTRTEFREFLVGWTLREIENEFRLITQSICNIRPNNSYRGYLLL